jgi:hypothetical protein
MSTLASPPLSLLHVDFPDLYGRHLCRHSQFGINVVHLIALFGVWFGIYAPLYWLTGVWWLPVALATAYLVMVATNAPARICLATAVFLAVFVAAVLWTPQLPYWAYLVMVPVFYEVQALSHKVWTKADDMTEFNKRYPKGSTLFVILLIYEVPMLLHYLFFDRKSA